MKGNGLHCSRIPNAKLKSTSTKHEALLGLLFVRRCEGEILEELVEAEEFAAKGAAVGGPFGFAGIEGESGAGGGEFRIEVVHVVEGQGFADHGELRRAEFVLAVMADVKMLDDGLQVGGKTLNGVHGFRNGFQFHHDVAEELAFDGVADGAVVAEFVEFANVVQNRGGQQQIKIKLRIMRGGLFREAAQTNDVLDQAAQIRMMHHFRRRSALVLRGDFRIRDNSRDQFLQPRICNRIRVFEQLRVQLSNVFFCLHEKIGEIDFLRLREAKLLKGKLRPVLVNLDARLDFYKIVAIDVSYCDVELVPHAGFDGAAAVAKLEAQIGLALAGIANLFFVNEEKGGNALFGVEIGDEGRLHCPELDRFPNRRNFLWPFFCLETSGVALTS